MKNNCQSLAIIGSGPSCVYLLKHILERSEEVWTKFERIEVFEKQERLGMGMPYSPETTERYNLSNISSEELPGLMCSLADWLRGLDAPQLEDLGITSSEEIREDEVYPRLALGAYLEAQFTEITVALEAADFQVQSHASCKIVDAREDEKGVTLVEDGGREFKFSRAVIATGHYWHEDDQPERGYFSSPWPISKLLPREGEMFNFTIGTLGASLSAFDVVTSLAHRHGTFTGDPPDLVYQPHPGSEGFRIVMHSADGVLPHLQFGQEKPLRKIFRHVSEKELLALRDEDGFLRLETYFDKVCRPALMEAFHKNGTQDLAEFLEDPEVGFVEFAERMEETHEYPDAFTGMRHELKEAEESHDRDRPIHWKEILDDLMYTLNYYAEMMPAEDHLTLRESILPFVMNVVAALPLPSAYILLALHEAGCLELKAGRAETQEAKPGAKTTQVTVTSEGEEEEKIEYRMFINCAGQKALEIEDFPFPSLCRPGGVRAARAPFRDAANRQKVPEGKQDKLLLEGGRWYYELGGVDIGRGYEVIGKDGQASRRIYNIAFPHTSGQRPYSYGLQACYDTCRLMVAAWLR